MNIDNLKALLKRSDIDETFACFFEALGYGVDFEGRLGTGERWHEIYDNDGLICQVSFGTPLAEFLTDLPHIIEGRSGVGPTNYWCACEDDKRLRALLVRIEAHPEEKGLVLERKGS